MMAPAPCPGPAMAQTDIAIAASETIAATSLRGIKSLMVVSLFAPAPTHFRRGRLEQLQTTTSEINLPVLWAPQSPFFEPGQC